MSDAVIHARAEQLLSFASNLCRIEALLSRNSGERFNVFRILKIKRHETRTHSPLLRELLDPKGTHGQGAAFLRLFLAECGLTENEFQAEGATVQEEYYIGQRTESEGGRIDLLLNDRRGRLLGIENKIDAKEQDNQVERYQRFLGKGHLVYLTLNGRVPSNYEKFQPGTLHCFSYGLHIIRWLDACRRHAATAPLVRESITQYLHLIQELTHQNEAISMSTELAQAALKDTKGLEAFFAICNARAEVDAQIVSWLEGKLDEIASRHGIARSEHLTSFRQRFSGFSFSNPLLNQNNLKVRFEFEYANGGGFAFGFVYLDAARKGEYADDLRRLFEEHFGKPEASISWPAWNMWKEFETWNDALLPEIRFGDRFLRDLEERLGILLSIAVQLFQNPYKTL